RGSLSDRSCGGQPRTVNELNGQEYEQVDLWYGSFNETNANTVLAPLAAMPCPTTQSQTTTAGNPPATTTTTTTSPPATTTSPTSTPPPTSTTAPATTASTPAAPTP